MGGYRAVEAMGGNEAKGAMEGKEATGAMEVMGGGIGARWFKGGVGGHCGAMGGVGWGEGEQIAQEIVQKAAGDGGRPKNCR